MKWMISEDRLGADQRDVIEEIGQIGDDPIWIKGHAGSGKSVLLLHAVKDYLARNEEADICVVVFTNSLVDLLKIGLQQIPFLENRDIPVLTIYEMRRKLIQRKKYDAIFCDEIQDVPIEFIAKMHNSASHFIIAGDAAQSIYSNVPQFNAAPASSDEISDTITPIEKELNVIYRLTNSVIKMLQNVFSEMLTDRSVLGDEDTQVKLLQGKSKEEEIEFCWKEASETNELRYSDVVAILINSRDLIAEFIDNILRLEDKPAWKRTYNRFGKLDFGAMNDHLEQHDIPIMYVGNGYGSLVLADQENKIIIITYHSSKGLDFDYVFLPLVNDEMWIGSNVDALLLVALSRSKSGLTISYTGKMYEPLKPFLLGITPLSIEPEDSNDEVIF